MFGYFVSCIGSQKVRSSLLFDHTLSADQMVNSIRDVQQSVTGMCEMSRVDVRPQLPALFTKFVRQLRTLDSRALQQLYTSTTPGPCEKAKYVILADVYANRFIAVDRSVAYIVCCILSISQSMYLIQATWPVWKKQQTLKNSL